MSNKKPQSRQQYVPICYSATEIGEKQDKVLRIHKTYFHNKTKAPLREYFHKG